MRRLAPRRQQRPVQHRVLHARRSGLPRPGGAQIRFAGSLFCRDPRPDFPKSHLSARGPDGSVEQYAGRVHAADHVGSVGPGRTERQILLQRPAGPRVVGLQVHVHLTPREQLLYGCGHGQPASRAYIDPRFVGEDQGVSNDDHPHADIRNGEVFLDSIYRAVTTGPAWRKTVLVINFDEWGGFFDHVPPPPGDVTEAERALGYTDGLRGFRVPCLVISPWSQHGRVPHAVYDHTSILKMIEWRFGLQPLSVRDAAARNLARVLDFDRPRFEVPLPTVPAGPFGGACRPALHPRSASSRRTTWLSHAASTRARQRRLPSASCCRRTARRRPSVCREQQGRARNRQRGVSGRWQRQ
jgi:hypothetical protein